MSALALYLPYPESDANFLLVVPFEDFLSTSVYCALTLSVFIVLSLILFVAYVAKICEQKPAGEVLGASTTEPDLSLPASCGEYLSDYLRYGKKNNVEQVKLLQSFLNEFVGTNLPITGFFGKMTHNAVKQFQVKYHSEIIKPWIDAGFKDKDIENGTGYVFKTTKREINLLKCASLNIPMPDLKAQ